MADEPIDPPIERPVVPTAGYQGLGDQGLNSWADSLHSHLAAQNGVEIIGKAGGSVHFKFRGQSFAVTVHRTA